MTILYFCNILREMLTENALSLSELLK